MENIVFDAKSRRILKAVQSIVKSNISHIGLVLSLMYQNEILQETCDRQVPLKDHQSFLITFKVGSKG